MVSAPAAGLSSISRAVTTSLPSVSATVIAPSATLAAPSVKARACDRPEAVGAEFDGAASGVTVKLREICSLAITPGVPYSMT